MPSIPRIVAGKVSLLNIKAVVGVRSLLLWMTTFFSCTTFEFPCLFWVFDLASGTWLEVVWAQTPNNHLLHNFPYFPFNALFPLGRHTLCLAGYTLDSPCVDIYFLKFSFSQCPTRPATLILTPLAFPFHQLPNTWQVANFLPIQHEIIGTRRGRLVEDEIHLS